MAAQPTGGRRRKLNRALPRRHYASLSSGRACAPRVQNRSTRQFTTRRYVSPPITSPIGPLLLAGDQHGLRFLLFAHGRKEVRPRPEWVADQGGLDEPVRQLNAYFRGSLRDFAIEVAPQGTEFQRTVWAELQRIPFGETISYGELASRIGNPKAVRAVGLANGSNQSRSSFLSSRDCSNGSLIGYGGGLPTKQALLALGAVRRACCEVHAP